MEEEEDIRVKSRKVERLVIDEDKEYSPRPRLPPQVPRIPEPIYEEDGFEFESDDDDDDDHKGPQHFKKEDEDDVRQVLLNQPPLWARHPKWLFVAYHLIKYNLLNFLFTSGYHNIGSVLLILSSLMVFYKLIKLIHGSWKRRMGTAFLLLSWAFFVYIQVRKYRFLYKILQHQRYFRMFLWQASGDLVDPEISVLLVLHMDAALELICLHIVYGFTSQEEDEQEDPTSIQAFLQVSWYEMALYYFIFTLPIDFNRPSVSEHPMVHSLYAINNVAIPLIVGAAFVYKFSALRLQTRYRYWAVLGILLSHPIYELLLFSSAKQSLQL